MGTLREDIDSSSKWVAQALTLSGYKADFSPESLIEIERFFSEHTKNGKPVKNGLLSKELGSRIFSIGSYVGEVIRINLNGEWITDDNDPEGEINVQLKINDGICWPMQKVFKRVKLGAEENIVAYGLGVGLKIDTNNRTVFFKEAKPWWKVWK